MCVCVRAVTPGSFFRCCQAGRELLLNDNAEHVDQGIRGDLSDTPLFYHHICSVFTSALFVLLDDSSEVHTHTETAMTLIGTSGVLIQGAEHRLPPEQKLPFRE